MIISQCGIYYTMKFDLAVDRNIIGSIIIYPEQDRIIASGLKSPSQLNYQHQIILKPLKST